MLIERAWVACTNMSAMRCCSAWKRPIGWPNCLRDLVYSMVVAFDRFHRADGLGAQRGDAALDRALERRHGIAVAEHVAARGSFTSLSDTSAALRPSCVR